MRLAMETENRALDRRISYELGELDEASVEPDPFAQFRLWFAQAEATPEISEPAAVAVATADDGGRPSVRIVLLRGEDERGFVFFTNYESRKGRELSANPHASMLFFWDTLQRQVRIDGRVERVDAPESDAYFARRPRGHRLSAWASPQSAVVLSRADLDRRFAEQDARFIDGEVPRPPYWGGYRVVPESFEFWQGRRNRVHDRIVYVRTETGWRIERIAP
jgi:pyridoxamine 5'-phosphate oxidase